MNDKLKYNPNIHHRRSIRLKGYDYSQAGLYFITICCQDRKCRFGKIENEKMILNEYGTIAYNEWMKLEERFPNFELDVFQIMPNHMHGIIFLNEPVGSTIAVAHDNVTKQNVGAGFTLAQNAQNAQNVDTKNENTQSIKGLKGQPQQQGLSRQNSDDDKREGASPTQTNATIGDIVGAYKSLVTNGCLEIYKSKKEMMGKLWQRNYHEHIIRNEQSYQNISNYIINNPVKWAEDKFYK